MVLAKLDSTQMITLAGGGSLRNIRNVRLEPLCEQESIAGDQVKTLRKLDLSTGLGGVLPL